MKKVNIHEAKARLSEYLEAVAAGERVMICKRNRPVAELVKAGAARSAPRPIGGAKGLVSVPAAFFDPLPDEEIEAFYPATYAPEAGSSRVAERPPRKGKRARRPSR